MIDSCCFVDNFKLLLSWKVSDHLRDIAHMFTGLENWSESEKSMALRRVHGALFDREDTVHVASAFPQLVPTLLSMPSHVLHSSKCVAMAKLLEMYPDILTYTLKYFEKSPPPWDDDSDSAGEDVIKKKRKEEGASDIEIAETCYRFLRASTVHFKSLWKWSDFFRAFLKHEDSYVRRLARHCAAVVTGADEVGRRRLVGPEPSLLRPLTLPLRSDCALKEDKLTGLDKICSSVVSVAGITLPVYDPVKAKEGSGLVGVASTTRGLRRAAAAVASGGGGGGRPICLVGPVGSGKTALVRHLARITGRDLATVQLGEESDAKALLGAYSCTDVPGEFVWRPGPLTRAMQCGGWLLLEDMDCASSDVVSLVAGLAETRTVDVPGYRDGLRAHPAHTLFLTHRSVGGGGTARQMLDKLWTQVNVEPLSPDELVTVVKVKFPALDTVAGRMVAVFLRFSAPAVQPAPHRARLTSTRDLMKWCTRAVVGFNVSSPDSALKILHDAIDIFCCNISDPVKRVSLARSVSSLLGVVATKAEFLLTDHKPQPLKTVGNLCVIGRASLHVNRQSRHYTLSEGVRFAETRTAACLLERVAACLAQSEPVLLVGETGVGKTASVQLLADRTHRTLVVINMNQQSDSADLLGGFKPVDVKFIIAPIRNEFERLFRSFFNVDENLKFLGHISNCFTRKRWPQLVQLMRHSQAAATARLMGKEAEAEAEAGWRALGDRLARLDAQLKRNRAALSFTFVEGTLMRALKRGWWVLLDEINLASAETLQCLSGLLEGGEAGVDTPHPDFRLLAAMNPATDIGKKDLPPGIRNRFTELFVDELTDRTELCQLVGCYLPELAPPRQDAVVRFYMEVRTAASTLLCDATGHRPHYSLRTLCRALVVAANNACGSTLRSLHSALCLSFLAQLDVHSYKHVLSLINRAVAENGDVKSLLGQPIPEPSPHGSHVLLEGYWIAKGQLEPSPSAQYILTASVRRNLESLCRAVSLSRAPVLLQGETCVGKTSLVRWLADATGNVCVRVNNHEHSDLQEYVGSYCADDTGALAFHDGALVRAMRLGHWIVLDELNLAPSDVLEALNRALDDNRELYLPETQETVRAHPAFRVFATQNPPGTYGGRKALSRAFRNRFIELHFDEIPPPELETILHLRCAMPVSYCRKAVAVMRELQVVRRGSAAFAGKHGFVTLRDLFRWGDRYRLAATPTGSDYYDWDQHLADEGYLVLAGRVRRAEETETVVAALERHWRRTVRPLSRLFTLDAHTSPVTRPLLERVVASPLPDTFAHVVWTLNLRKLAVLVGKALDFGEPVLLVGETGCGKTTVAQLMARLAGRRLLTVNCHQHTDSADFLGAMRPVRHTAVEGGLRLFEWSDGPLVEAMREGHWFLADEISLAEDSVLERLNSLLEPERTLLLSEKGDGGQTVAADPRFKFVSTMNPGGDYGKKELSPALRNRLTEVWCEGVTEEADWVLLVERNVRAGLSLAGNQQDGTSGIGRAIVAFMRWFRTTRVGTRVSMSVRDVLTWVRFVNAWGPEGDRVGPAYVHGGCLAVTDALGTGNTARVEGVDKERRACLRFLAEQSAESFLREAAAVVTATHYGIPPFFIPLGDDPREKTKGARDFTLGARTTCLNASRLLRALQLPGRAILLEGSPGVGKTSLVEALALASGHALTRINLSDQTDASDLFGADLPVEGAGGGVFAWRDGPFLRALKLGHWILLDELNLASQSVLESMNAVLDHRGELYVPELGRVFAVDTARTRLFACQNPLAEGGARRGLPQSFLNRFTQVYMEPLSADDLNCIAGRLHPGLPVALVEGMVRVTRRLGDDLNLRDLTRWARATESAGGGSPQRHVGLVYADRMRTADDKRRVLEVYTEELGGEYPLPEEEEGLAVAPSEAALGATRLVRTGTAADACPVDRTSTHLLLRGESGAVHSVAGCVSHGWPALVVGGAGAGKTAAVRALAQLCARRLHVINVNSAMDTTEILGGFEQVHI